MIMMKTNDLFYELIVFLILSSYIMTIVIGNIHLYHCLYIVTFLKIYMCLFYTERTCLYVGLKKQQ